jgi:hypothetical protein
MSEAHTKELICFVMIHILKYLRGHVVRQVLLRDSLLELNCAGLLTGSCMHKDTQRGHLLCPGEQEIRTCYRASHSGICPDIIRLLLGFRSFWSEK